MVTFSESFLREWRENYHWPLRATRKESEEKILALEKAVTENIIVQQGNRAVKHVLSDIVDWKTSGRQVEKFNENDDTEINAAVDHVLETISYRPGDVSDCIRTLVFENGLKSVGIPVASTFLRFFDPVNHQYGIIDRYIARLLDKEGITSFEYEDIGLAKALHNVDEYQKFHFWLKQKAEELRNSFTSIHGAQVHWTPVDVEMALFACCTRSHVKARTIRNIDSPAKMGRCPKCGSPLTWHTARLTGERYRGCANYPSCNYNERSY